MRLIKHPDKKFMSSKAFNFLALYFGPCFGDKGEAGIKIVSFSFKKCLGEIAKDPSVARWMSCSSKLSKFTENIREESFI